VDFEVWNGLLKRYVDEHGRVDYGAWKIQDAGTLHQWLDGLSGEDTQTTTAPFSPEAPIPERLATWINLYNALTILKVLNQYPIRSIQPKILGIPNWIAFLAFFLLPTYRLNGTAISLNYIEHQILRKDFQEPRIHFALVCASLGCPLLRQEAYDPQRIYDQLEDDAHRFITNPDKVRYDTRANTLHCSKIFKWYRDDFLAIAPSIQEYIASYLAPTSSASLPDTNTPIRYLPYDWNLNQQ
jgi:hypothetical protein